MAEADVNKNWQRGKSLMQCLEYSFHTKIHSDVSFKVGRTKTTIQAHKFLLVLRSSVFQAMFRGTLAEQNDIIIPEVESDVFEDFLKYLYTDDVIMTGQNVMGLLYLSKKYDVTTLEQRCVTFLSSSMRPDCASTIMEQGHVFNQVDLMEKALNCILDNGDDALKSDDIISLCQVCLLKIVKEDKLIADEKSVFEAVVTWSENECKKQSKELTPQNKRDVLGDIIMHVRYPLLDQKYFVKTVVPAKLLRESEEKKILMHMISPDENVSPFNANKRSGVTQSREITTEIHTRPVTVERFTESDYRYKTNGNVTEAITFSVNQDASLRGFQVYGVGSPDVRVFMTNAMTDEIIEGSRDITLRPKAQQRNIWGMVLCSLDVMFTRSLRLIPDVKYNLVITFNGGILGRGSSSRSEVKHGSFVCRFFKSQPSKHSPGRVYSDVESGIIKTFYFLV